MMTGYDYALVGYGLFVLTLIWFELVLIRSELRQGMMP